MTTVVAVFEVKDWERIPLTQGLAGLDVRLLAEPLTEQTADQAAEATVISVFVRSRVTADLLRRLPAVRCLVTRSTGYDHIDLAACRARGITVCNAPDYATVAVAEHTFALLLTLSRKVHLAAERTRACDFSLEGLLGFDLAGKTLGVIGTGRIGQHVIRLARGFGMTVLAYDVVPRPELAAALGFSDVALDDLLSRSDVISLHVPYTPQTHHLINRAAFTRMKRGVVLLNTARGAVVETEALLWALSEGIVAGAGLDVLEGEEWLAEEQRLLAEPLQTERLRAVFCGHLLTHYENVVITPHVAFYSREALDRLVQTTVENIRAFLAGRPQNVVP